MLCIKQLLENQKLFRKMRNSCYGNSCFKVHLKHLNTNYPPFRNVIVTIATMVTQFFGTVSDSPKAALYKALNFIILKKYCAKY